MKYILLIYGDEMTWNSIKDSASQQEAEKIHSRPTTLYGEKMAKAGVIRGGAELKPTVHRHQHPFQEQQAHHYDRRSVRRNQGATGRILRH